MDQSESSVISVTTLNDTLCPLSSSPKLTVHCVSLSSVIDMSFLTEELSSKLKSLISTIFCFSLAVSTIVESEATLKSKYQVTIVSGNYYKLEFDLATIFGNKASEVDSDKYGATVYLEGFGEMTKISTNSELKTYTVYLNCTSDSTEASICLKLVSESDKTLGTALLTHINLVSSSETEYKQASLLKSYNKSVFTSSQSEETETDTDEDTSKEMMRLSTLRRKSFKKK